VRVLSTPRPTTRGSLGISITAFSGTFTTHRAAVHNTRSCAARMTAPNAAVPGQPRKTRVKLQYEQREARTQTPRRKRSRSSGRSYVASVQGRAASGSSHCAGTPGLDCAVAWRTWRCRCCSPGSGTNQLSARTAGASDACPPCTPGKGL
jgi:hypothetical protein